MYGPRAMVVCGYEPQQQQLFLDALRKEQYTNIAVVFADQESIAMPVHELFGQKHCHKLGKESHIPRAVILSGITQRELHSIMDLSKALQFPRQLWATLTPTAETWQLGDLLIALENERKAMQAKRS